MVKFLKSSISGSDLMGLDIILKTRSFVIVHTIMEINMHTLTCCQDFLICLSLRKYNSWKISVTQIIESTDKVKVASSKLCAFLSTKKIREVFIF